MIITFTDNNLEQWVSHSKIYKLAVEEEMLIIAYNRSGANTERWDSFSINSQKVHPNISEIAITIKSSVNAELSVKPYPEYSNLPPVSRYVTASDEWRTLIFQIISKKACHPDRLYFYIDADTTISKKGTLRIKEIRINEPALYELYSDWSGYEQAIKSAEALLNNSAEGSKYGEFNLESFQHLKSSILEARKIKGIIPINQSLIDKAINKLQDACIRFEISYNRISSDLSDQFATKETCNLYRNLRELGKKGILVGMQNATGFGVGWSGDDSRSDIKDICGDYPAVFGEELYYIELNYQAERMRNRIINAYNSGSVITLCWHMYDIEYDGFYSKDVKNTMLVKDILPGGIKHNEYKEKLNRIAFFIKSLRGSQGESIPVIFRPFHEHTSRAFWWGAHMCTSEEYISLWKLTHNYLCKDLHVHNLIYAISPMLQHIKSKIKYSKRYPGDEFVDILGSDFYFKRFIPYFWNKLRLSKGLRSLTRLSLKRNKPAAITEIGNLNLSVKDWFYNILQLLKNHPFASNILYMNLWHNKDKDHHFAPYKGHISEDDFIKFYKDPFTFFQKDIRGIYNKLPANSDLNQT